MRLTWFGRSGAPIAAALLAASLLAGALPAGAAPFDGSRGSFVDNGFQRAWSRTDSEPVRGGRTWYWGPAPWFDYAEFYRQGEAGLRTVQYFDKARMELNNPADRSGPNAGVTNGLLVKELVSGRVQLGNDPYDYDQRPAAVVPVAGDPRAANPSAPGYSSFAGVATLDNGYRDPQRIGERVGTTIDNGGNIGPRPDLALPETEIVQYNSVTGHNIPRVFWEFLNQTGRINTERGVTTGPVVDWLFAMGLPITDAYWTRSRIGGVEQDVLVQLFERRVLTYVPANPAGYKVEMGNVGQHYFQWRYPHLGAPWAMADPEMPLLYASNVDTGRHWEIYRNTGNGALRLSRNSEETVAFSWRRSWDPGQLALLVDSRRSNAQYRQIYEFGAVSLYDGDYAWNAQVRRISYSDGTPPPPNGPFPGYLPNGVSSDYNASYSPDGTKILFASDRMGNGSQELFIMGAAGNAPAQLTSQGCVNETPTWSPEGRRIYWASNCDGDFELYRADVAYGNDVQWGVDARLLNVTKLTDNSTDDRFARVAPNGRAIAYSTLVNGKWDLAVLYVGDGRIASYGTPGNDEAPTWSSDGRTLAFASDSDGDYEIYTLPLDGGRITQVTFNNAQDRWPLWAQ